MNQLLQNSLAEYGITGDKVTRLIASAKYDWLFLLHILLTCQYYIYYTFKKNIQ